ncbi:MAG: precorrin-2 C(20)-methyltransferase [Methanomassiliicoccaceae archaeon]|nr:precorrin-2 C(20)-methyltransferase [Methanomassiliicoccaceae archaeon]
MDFEINFYGNGFQFRGELIAFLLHFLGEWAPIVPFFLSFTLPISCSHLDKRYILLLVAQLHWMYKPSYNNMKPILVLEYEMPGKLYGVSVGPGDPELITIKAKRRIESSDTIAYPVKAHGENSTALNIVKKAMDLSGKRIEEILFEMDPDPAVRESNYQSAIKKTASLLDEGDVAMINLGDATVFSTYMHISMDIFKMGYKTETIPGVTSFCSGAAEAKIPLVIDNEGLAVVPMTKKNDLVFRALRDFDNIVVMKAFNSMKILASMLDLSSKYLQVIIKTYWNIHPTIMCSKLFDIVSTKTCIVGCMHQVIITGNPSVLWNTYGRKDPLHRSGARRPGADNSQRKKSH